MFVVILFRAVTESNYDARMLHDHRVQPDSADMTPFVAKYHHYYHAAAQRHIFPHHQHQQQQQQQQHQFDSNSRVGRHVTVPRCDVIIPPQQYVYNPHHLAGARDVTCEQWRPYLQPHPGGDWRASCVPPGAAVPTFWGCATTPGLIPDDRMHGTSTSTAQHASASSPQFITSDFLSADGVTSPHWRLDNDERSSADM